MTTAAICTNVVFLVCDSPYVARAARRKAYSVQQDHTFFDVRALNHHQATLIDGITVGVGRYRDQTHGVTAKTEPWSFEPPNIVTPYKDPS